MGMFYKFDFDICALLVLIIVLIFNYSKRHTPLLQNHLFITIIWTIIFTTIFDIVSGIYDVFYDDLNIHFGYFVNVGYFSLLNFIPPTYCFYTLTLTDTYELIPHKHRKKVISLLFTPYIISLAIILLTPILANKVVLAFYFDQTGCYHRGDFWFYLLYIIAGVYFAITFIILIARRKVIKVSKMILISLFIIFSLTTVAIQLKTNLLLQCFGISYTLLLFTFTIQKPEDRIDSVTNLFNSNAFTSVVEQKFRNNKTFYCAGIIIESIPYLINTFGIKTFNDLLESIAVYLKSHTPKGSVYHINQGRMCIVFSDVEMPLVQKTISEILRKFQFTWTLDKLQIKINIRTCLITCPEDAKTSEDIVDFINLVADEDRFKRGGIAYASNIDKNLKKRANEIDYILKNAFTIPDTLDVYYQAIFSVKDNRIIGAEALIRLRDMEGTLSGNSAKGDFISPEEFIPIAEKNGTIFSLGEYVLEQVCQLLSSINPEQYGISKIEINLSVIQCMQDNIVEQIKQITEIYNTNRKYLNFEITETAAAYQQDTLLKTMDKLRDIGVEFSLDDYGSGHATMEYMVDLPFDIIKIDKGIVWNAHRNPSTNVALASTIAMISDLGRKVLAEGVETSEQAEWLKALGCDYLQGYYYSKPLSRNEFIEFLKQKNHDIYDKYTQNISYDDIEELEVLSEI